MSGFERNDRIIGRKFFQFLLPTVLSTVAVSLNEFVDSIIVSQLLGSSAMSMVGMGSPVMLLFAVIYMMIGSGGSVIYAEYAGKQQQDRARSAFSVVFIASVIIGVFISVFGMVFIRTVTGWFCADDSLIGAFRPYLTVLVLSGAFIIPLQVIIIFFPAFGKPHLGTMINICANGINLIMDYVFIRFFDTGVAGASLATLTGYIAAAVIVVILIAAKRISLPLVRVHLSDLDHLKESVKRGVASALSQLGYCIKIYFCNNLSASLAGMTGLTIFTVCIQCVSIVSISIGGIVGAMAPLASALRGQGDFRGMRILMKKVLLTQTLASIVFFLMFELRPEFFLAIYNYGDSNAKSATAAIRIFSIMFLFRGFVMIFMYYFQVISRNVYAAVISITDGFAGIIPLAVILTRAMGIDGLWAAYPLLSALMLLVIVIVNHAISARSGGQYSGILVLPNEDADLPVYDATVPLERNETERVVCDLQDFCKQKLTSEKTCVLIALAFEEMISYTADNTDQKSVAAFIDVLLQIYPDEVLMDVRSIGKPHDPSTAPAEEYSNVDVLRKAASSVEYNYVLGMNQTRIRIAL